MNEQRLKELRMEIDFIDDSIVEMLKKRVRVALEIGKTKGNGPIYDPVREKAVIRRIQDLAPEIDGESLASVYTEIMSLCRSVQSGGKTGTGGI